MWHLSTQVNGGILAEYISIFDVRRGKHRRFIILMVYALVYPIISSNLVNLATLSPWSDYVCLPTCYLSLRKPLLR